MAKYIIEFEDEPSMVEAGLRYYRCKQVPYWSLSHEIIKNLTPYTEPDRKAIEDEVWGLVGAIANMDNNDYGRVFGCIGRWTLLSKKTYQEVKEKYEAWKKEQQEIRVGDEVEDNDGTRGVVFGIDGTDVLGVCWEDERMSHFFWPKTYCRKTGRHFSEAERLLEALKTK